MQRVVEKLVAAGEDATLVPTVEGGDPLLDEVCGYSGGARCGACSTPLMHH